MQEFRSQTEWERALFSRLLERPFPGNAQLAEQLQNALVRQIDDEGSLGIQVRQPAKAEVFHRIPVEAECEDSDGIKLHLLLHVVNGVAEELEIYKEDGSPINMLPSVEMLRVASVP